MQTMHIRIGVVATAVLAAVALFPASGLAIGVIETPDGSAVENGIGVISGWHCEGDLIQVRIDDGELTTAASRTPRNDTLPICSRSDTGFATLLNFNRLKPSLFPGRPEHEVVAYADGVEFDRVTFETTNFGENYSRGLSATYRLLNFPDVGDVTVVEWNESKQDFTVAGTPITLPSSESTASRISGNYHGAKSYHVEYDEFVKYGTFKVEIDGPIFMLRAEYADGEVWEFSAPWYLDTDGYVRAQQPGRDFFVRANGERLFGTLKDLGGVILTGSKFVPFVP